MVEEISVVIEEIGVKIFVVVCVVVGGDDVDVDNDGVNCGGASIVYVIIGNKPYTSGQMILKSEQFRAPMMATGTSLLNEWSPFGRLYRVKQSALIWFQLNSKQLENFWHSFWQSKAEVTFSILSIKFVLSLNPMPNRKQPVRKNNMQYKNVHDWNSFKPLLLSENL